MLEHQKKVLLGVANNPRRFRKEIVKSLVWLSDEESEALYYWVKKEFGSNYSQILSEVFLGMSV
ncbi:hypothetical protein [Saccharicrinis fermentans]|nr:hypothetical protein [Saccharicrinis fermentans]